MGQKVNPKIFRLGIKTQWDSRYFERKKEEATLYSYQNIEILSYLKQFLLLNGLMLQKTKFHFNDTNLYIHISYFSTKKSFFLINNKMANQNIKLKNSMPQNFKPKLIRGPLIKNTLVKPKVMKVYHRKTTFQQWPSLFLKTIRKSPKSSFLGREQSKLIQNSKKILESSYFLDKPYLNKKKKIKKKLTFFLFKKLAVKKKLALFKKIASKKRFFSLKKFAVKNVSFSAYKKYVKAPSSFLFKVLMKKETGFSYNKFVGKKASSFKKFPANPFLISFKKILWLKNKLKEKNQFKIQRLGILNSYKTFLQHKTYNNNEILKKNLFLEQFFEGLSLYTNKKYNIFLTFQNLNRGMSVLLSQIEQDFIKKRLLSLRRYSKEKFFKESLNIMLIVIKIKNSARLIAELIAQNFKFLKRHNYFVTFIKRIISLFISFKFSKVKGIKICISGRFNRAPRAKSRLIIVGDMPIQTISKHIDYHETTSYTKNGTFGIKLWINYV